MAAAPMAAAFALTPALAVNGILALDQEQGRKLWEKGCQKLDDEQFSCQQDEIIRLVKAVEQRATNYGWNVQNSGILWVPKSLNDMDDCVNLLKSYGTVSLQTITEFVDNSLTGDTRETQDDYMLGQAIMNSLAPKGKARVLLKHKLYTIDDRISGVALLKVVLMCSHIDTNATTAAIKDKLTRLDTYMVEIGYNVEKFTEYVNGLIHELGARGEQSSDLLVNLFKAYETVNDADFIRYIGRKRDEYEEGMMTMSAAELMAQAETKYKILQVKGTWNAPSPEAEQIMALEAKIKSLSKGHRSKAKKDQENESNGGAGQKMERRNKKPHKITKNIAPKNDEPKTIKWRNADYHWCHETTGGKCGGKWRCHKPSECLGKGHRNKKRTPEKGDSANVKVNKDKSKKLKLAKAYAAIADEDSE